MSLFHGRINVGNKCIINTLANILQTHRLVTIHPLQMDRQRWTDDNHAKDVYIM